MLTRSRVFLTGADRDKLYTQCFDRSTGKLVWERSEPLTRTDGVNRLNHAAAITPVTDGENVYVFFKDFGLISYDGAGKARWRVPLGPFHNTMGLGASPILADGLLILQVDQLDHSFLAAYSTRDGELRWKAAREVSESWGTPLVSGDQIVTVGAGHVIGHRLRDGRKTFDFGEVSPLMVASPVLHGGALYAFGYGMAARIPFAKTLERLDRNKDGVLSPDEFGPESMYAATANYLGNRDGVITEDEWNAWADHVGGFTGMVALQLDPGARPMWRFEKGFEGAIPSPIVFDGLVYAVKNGGILTAWDAKTGERAKTGRITGAPGGYTASLTAADGRLYAASEEGKVSVIRPGRDWEVLQVNDIGGEEIHATPALSGGLIFVRTHAALYCFGAR